MASHMYTLVEKSMSAIAQWVEERLGYCWTHTEDWKSVFGRRKCLAGALKDPHPVQAASKWSHPEDKDKEWLKKNLKLAGPLLKKKMETIIVDAASNQIRKLIPAIQELNVTVYDAIEKALEMLPMKTHTANKDELVVEHLVRYVAGVHIKYKVRNHFKAGAMTIKVDGMLIVSVKRITCQPPEAELSMSFTDKPRYRFDWADLDVSCSTPSFLSSAAEKIIIHDEPLKQQC